MSAATDAAAGAAALVPKKLGKVSGSEVLSAKKKVVFPPSGAVKFGRCRTIAEPSRVPVVSNRMLVLPREEKGSTSGGFTPYAGVLYHGAAATAAAPLALACPKIAPLLVLNS